MVRNSKVLSKDSLTMSLSRYWKVGKLETQVETLQFFLLLRCKVYIEANINVCNSVLSTVLLDDVSIFCNGI